MALPKVECPTFFLTLPSTGEKIKYRPFLVKEEKILMIALHDNQDTIVNAVKEIVENCTFRQVDISKLTTYDIEYLFLNIRIKSKGNIVNLEFRCQNEIAVEGEDEKKKCNYINEIEVDLETVEIANLDKKRKKTIILDEKNHIGVELKEPTLETSARLQDATQSKDLNRIYETLNEFVDTIFQGEQVYDDYTIEEFNEFIENLSDTQFQKINNFFENMPRLYKKIEIECEHCKSKDEVVLEGLTSFLE